MQNINKNQKLPNPSFQIFHRFSNNPKDNQRCRFPHKDQLDLSGSGGRKHYQKNMDYVKSFILGSYQIPLEKNQMLNSIQLSSTQKKSQHNNSVQLYKDQDSLTKLQRQFFTKKKPINVSHRRNHSKEQYIQNKINNLDYQFKPYLRLYDVYPNTDRIDNKMRNNPTYIGSFVLG